MKNETPLAADAPGLTNFPTVNTTQKKLWERPEMVLQQKIPSPGIPQRLLCKRSLLGLW